MPPERRFAASLGAVLILQSMHTLSLLAAAIPIKSSATLRFSHSCLPLAPDLVPQTILALACASIQAICGLWLSACATLGRSLRPPALCAAASMAYMLLLEAAVYQNHYYLVLHVLLCLALVPCDPYASTLRNLLRFTTSLPYVFGALSKLTSPDWIFRYQPARRWCEKELMRTVPVFMPATWLASPHYV